MGVAVCVVGTGPSAEQTADAVRAWAGAGARILGGAAEPPAAEVAVAAAALEAAGRDDVVLVPAGVELGAGWLDALIAAAADGTVASAAALPAELLFAPGAAGDVAAAADSAARWSLRLRPRIARPPFGAVLLRRAAVDAVGGLDPAIADLPAALADWAERCSAAGLEHVLADDAVSGVGGLEEASALGDRRLGGDVRDRVLATAPALRRSVRASARGLRPLGVTFDGRALGPGRTGTQVHALELASALMRTGRVELRVVVPFDVTDQARAVLSGGAELLDYQRAADAPPAPTDIVHRPSQVFSAHDLALLVRLGDRLVVTHQDLIAFRMPSYHASLEEWERYRDVTRYALGGADHVVFFSGTALADALRDDLVRAEAASVVPIGVDHRVLSAAAPRPPRAPAQRDQPFLVCLGIDLAHKQRTFALRLLRALRERGWPGRLVLAGPHADHGSSVAAEERLLERNGELADAVNRLGAVDDAERAWLLENAAAVVYPTLDEGFGLIPFEAAVAGTPCLFAHQSSLRELLPADTATITPWDAEASASAALPLLTAGAAREAHVAAIRAAAGDLTWDRAAHALVDLYEEVVVRPSSEVVQGPRERLRLAQELAESQEERLAHLRRDAAFRAALGPDALSLVGPGGVLERRDQRALLALLYRRPVRRMVLPPLRLLYRLAHRGR